MCRTKWNIELVKKEIGLLGYFMGDIEFTKSTVKFSLYDVDGYYYFSKLHKVFSRNLRKFHKSNPYTIQNIKLWCKLNNKPFELLSEEYINRSGKLKFQCLKDGCNEIFTSTLNDILDDCGCPFCAGKQVGLSNCLATKRPDLIEEWHPILNGNLTPYNVTCGRRDDVWWQCEKGHEWLAKIYNRCRGDNCPYCSGKYPSDNHNLLISNPELCDNWNYEKNNKRPEDYCPNSGQSVWWKCKECGHEWKSIIDNQNNNRNCPRCSESNGEKEVDNILKYHSIDYIFHHSFPDCRYKNPLEFDFYLPIHIVAIEYQGRQHYEPVDFAGKGEEWALEQFKLNQIRDQIKRNYCKNNNIKLIEIPYWEFDNIETILKNELKI